MKMIEVWETDDGKTFKSITEARVHQECLKYLPEIEAFIESDACNYKGKAAKAIIKSAIISWVFWKADGGNK
jgi:hypothetical protein